MKKIFISYRREDSEYPSDRLREALKPYVGDPDRDIFIDIDNIPLGVDFVEYLDAQVARCDVLLAVIGPDWLSIQNPATKRRRLEDPSDFVRIEIASALKRGIPVAPILLDGTPFPSAAALPEDLAPLTRRHGIKLQRETFEADVSRLARGLGLFRRETSPVSKLIGAVTASALGTPDSTRVGAREFKDSLRDGSSGAVMVIVPAGNYLMGSPHSEAERSEDEGPQRLIEIGYEFAVGKFPVTWAEWDLAVLSGGCPRLQPDRFGGGSRPVTNISWEEAVAYTKWLSAETAQRYRLLSEAEWEYAARAGATTAYAFGDRISHELANFNSVPGKTTPVGHYKPNAFGLHDMHGNVWEWVQDSYEDSYAGGKPSDGSPYVSKADAYRVNRGGSWMSTAKNVRAAYRSRNEASRRYDTQGFRVARDL